MFAGCKFGHESCDTLKHMLEIDWSVRHYSIYVYMIRLVIGQSNRGSNYGNLNKTRLYITVVISIRRSI